MRIETRYDGNTRKGDYKFCHNCTAKGGKEVRWKFEVLDANKKVIGHVAAGLKCDKNCGDESAQKSKILKIATGLLPK